MVDSEQEMRTPLEVQDIEVTEDGRLLVTGRWHVGGSHGSVLAADIVDPDELSVTDTIEARLDELENNGDRLRIDNFHEAGSKWAIDRVRDQLLEGGCDA